MSNSLSRLMENVARDLENWRRLNGGKLPKWKLELPKRFYLEHEGERVHPPWMGVSYYHFDKDTNVLFLVPFNFIISWVREWYSYLRYRFYPLKIEKEKKAAYDAGYRAGLNRRFGGDF